ncbi:MAG: class I SAM-dependent methyltransferase [Actinomycetia bacterium]|nr:class I SAM-dependent methyltransferase [Actinomycetes bacterium]
MDGPTGQGRGPAARDWARALAEWAIPPEIMATAERSPWAHPVHRFADRADAAVARPGGPSFERARAALAASPGTVLDVGAGAGAASLPLAPWTSAFTAVDRVPAMLDAYRERAAALHRPAAAVEGAWPDVAPGVAVHDVVVCHHVVYDVADIGPFLRALTGHARRLVVLELPPRHPLTWMAPLWQAVHGVVRPTRPTADDLVAVLCELGLAGDLVVDRWRRAEEPDVQPLAERAALVAQRLCLPQSREAEVAALLDGVDRSGLGDVVTLAWPGSP